MDDKNLHFLTKTAEILTKQLDSSELVQELRKDLISFFEIKDFNIYVYDPNTSTLRDYSKNWAVIDEILPVDNKESIYRAYESIHGNDFVIDNKAYRLPQTVSEISFKFNDIYIPIVRDGMVFGVITVNFPENTSVNMEFLFLMKIFF